MHSKAYEEFVNQINTTGRMQGYNPELLELIKAEENEEIQQRIVEAFLKGDIEMTIFMPRLSLVNGIEMLKEKVKTYKKPCYAYCEILCVLFITSKDEVYLDNLISALDCSDEDERMNAIMALLRCGKNEKLYSVYKNGCLNDDDELVRSRCAVGMLFCKNIISNPLRIEALADEWKEIKINLYDSDKENRKNAVETFESMINK